jgi:hypothetical protein
MRPIYPQNLMLIISYNFTELWFFNSALLLNEIYLPTKFHVDISLELGPGQSSKSKNKQRAKI